MTSIEQGRRRNAIVLGIAARRDYFTLTDVPEMTRKVAQVACLEMARAGTLIRVQPHKGPIPAIFALPNRLIQKCHIAKLEAECWITRMTLKFHGK